MLLRVYVCVRYTAQRTKAPSFVFGLPVAATVSGCDGDGDAEGACCVWEGFVGDARQRLGGGRGDRESGA